MTKTKPAKRKPGRPPLEYDQKIGDAICVHLVNGKSLSEICRRKGMPSKDTVYKWIRQHPSFADVSARAREDQGDTYADRVLELEKRVTAANAQAMKVRIDALKWAAGVRRPRRYGAAAHVTVDADVRVERGEVDRDHMLIETGRSVGLIMEMAREAVERQSVPRLAAPAEPRQDGAAEALEAGAAAGGPAGVEESEVARQLEAEAAAKREEANARSTERLFEKEVGMQIRSRNSLPSSAHSGRVPFTARRR